MSKPFTEKEIDQVVDETAARILGALDDMAIWFGTNTTRRIAEKVLAAIPQIDNRRPIPMKPDAPTMSAKEIRYRRHKEPEDPRPITLKGMEEASK